MTTKTIIVGYDRSSEARAAAAWALDEAARTGAPVEFLYAYEWPTWAPAASMVPSPAVWPDGETVRAVNDALNDAVVTAKDTHPSVTTKISIVHAKAALMLIERSADASLVVMGSRGFSAIEGLLGSASVAVSAHAHCPVIVVRGEAATADPVVVGVDDSPSAQLALGFAFEQSAGRGVALRVIRSWTPTAAIWEDRGIMAESVTAGQRQELRDLVSGWREKFPDVKVSEEVVMDHPANALALASTTAQLLVVGTRGRGTVRGTLLGSVSQHLLRHSACSVAVVREIQDR